jgi:antitoxin VapB
MKPSESEMSLEFDDPETDRLAHAVAALTGESLAETVRRALAEKLERERLKQGKRERLAERLMEIGAHCAALPDIDPRSPDELVGYDENGLPA